MRLGGGEAAVRFGGGDRATWDRMELCNARYFYNGEERDGGERVGVQWTLAGLDQLMRLLLAGGLANN
jgi:hypothetical protein